MTSSTILVHSGRKSALRVPILLFAGAITSFTLGFVAIDMALLLLLVQNSSHYSFWATVFYRLGFILEMLGSYLVYLTLTLPRMKEISLQSLFIQLLTVSIFGVSAAINASTIRLMLMKTDFNVEYDMLGLIMLLVAIGFVIHAFILRLREIMIVMSSKNLKKTFSLRILSIMVLIILTMGLLLWDELADVQDIPSFAWTASVSIIFAMIAHSIRRNYGFFFAIPVTVDALYILDSRSSLTLYSRHFAKDIPHGEAFLGSTLGGLKLSLETLMRSKEGLRTITFEDKVLIMHSRSLVTTVLVASDSTLLLLELLSNMTKLFEDMFNEQLKPSWHYRIIEPQTFSHFDAIVEDISEQLLL